MVLALDLQVDPWVSTDDVDFIRGRIRTFIEMQKGHCSSSFIFHVNATQLNQGYVNFIVRIRLKHGTRYCDTGLWRPINTNLTLWMLETLRLRNINCKILQGWLDPHYVQGFADVASKAEKGKLE